MEERAERLRGLVAALFVGGQRRRAPAPLRAKVASYVRSERAAGTTWSRIAETIGLSEIALRRWTASADAAEPSLDGAGTPLRPVRVRDEARAVERSSLVLVLAQGARLEGLGLDEAIALVRALG